MVLQTLEQRTDSEFLQSEKIGPVKKVYADKFQLDGKEYVQLVVSRDRRSSPMSDQQDDMWVYQWNSQTKRFGSQPAQVIMSPGLSGKFIV